MTSLRKSSRHQKLFDLVSQEDRQNVAPKAATSQDLPSDAARRMVENAQESLGFKTADTRLSDDLRPQKHQSLLSRLLKRARS